MEARHDGKSSRKVMRIAELSLELERTRQELERTKSELLKVKRELDATKRRDCSECKYCEGIMQACSVPTNCREGEGWEWNGV